MTKDEALRLALEALETCGEDERGQGFNDALVNEAITAIKAALEAKDEPVETEIVTAEQHDRNLYAKYKQNMKSRNWISFNDWLLETTPPQRTWVGLTNEDLEFLFPHGKSVWLQETVKIIEAKLKAKNS
jgi:hypothetical protein